MTRRTLMWCAVLGALGMVAAGCGRGGGVKLYPASGVVTYRNQPVEGAVVTFRCEEVKVTATGRTDAQGRFELSTFHEGKSAKGAPAGKYKVTVTKEEVSGGAAGGDASMEAALKQASSGAAAPKNVLPPKYANVSTSGLEYTIESSGKNEFQIQLTD